MGDQEDHRREVEKTQRKLLATEAALLLLLRRKVRRQVLPGDPWAARATLSQSLASVYLTGRIVAHTAGLTRLEAELQTIDPELAALVPAQGGMADAFGISAGLWALLGSRRSRVAADGYADRWLRLVREEQAAGTLNPYDAAFKRAAPRLELGAVTENSEAFNRARQDAIRRISHTRTDVDLVRVWNAVLDKRTCERCSRNDGKWIEAAASFPEGEPGSIHNRCRCTDELMPRHWVSNLDVAA